jgi:hypothetical protein
MTTSSATEVSTPFVDINITNNDDNILTTDTEHIIDPKLTASDLVMAEIRSAVKTTQDYDTKIKTAKTSAKKAYFHKKMVANNQYVMKLLMVLERYKQVSSAADQMAIDVAQEELIIPTIDSVATQQEV